MAKSKSELKRMQELLKNHTELNELCMVTPSQVHEILMGEYFRELTQEELDVKEITKR